MWRTLKHPTGFYLMAALALVLFLGVFSPRNSAPSELSQGQISSEPAPDDVIATLQAGRTPLPDAAHQALLKARRAPENADLALMAAQAIIQVGREQADTRLVGTALALLRPHLATGRADILLAAATARQFQHDFTGALKLLDDAVLADPQNIPVFLTRATLHIVRGEYRMARADCDRILALRQRQIGFLCHATSHILTRQGPAFRMRLETALGQPGLLDPGLRTWAAGLVAEIALNQGDRPTAQHWLKQVLTLDPAAQRERLLLADLLIAEAKPDEALIILAPLPDSDGALIRRALALRATGQTDKAMGLQQVLAQRVQLNIDLGLHAHAREDAMYFLWLADDPQRALERAQINWSLQHEAEDAALLQAAAKAASAPDALTAQQLWMQTEDILPAPELDGN